MQGESDAGPSWRERSAGKLAKLFAWVLIASGLFVLGTAEGFARFWLAGFVVSAGLVVLLLHALRVSHRVLSAVVVGLAFTASLAGFAWAGFLSGPGVALTTSVMLTGLLMGRRAMFVSLLLAALALALIGWGVTSGFIAAPAQTNLDPTRGLVWLRTLSVSLLVLVLFASVLASIVEHVDDSLRRAEAELHRRERAERLRAEAERKALETRHLETLGRLASGVAHDFNNNLTAIIGLSELLKAQLPADSPHRELVEDILGASLRSADLTQQLLAYSRKARVQPAGTAIDDLVETSLKLVRRSLNPNVEVALACAAPGVQVSADPALLQSAVMNLLINARDAMPRGGRLSVQTRVEPNSDADGASSVVLEIADTGMGMEPEVLSRAFEPFFTTKGPGEGTGLGLSAVAGTVESHGGTIDVDSAPGRGSTFRIRLPVLAGVTASAEQDVVGLPHGSGEVLIVDDEARVRHAASALLGSLGYRITLAEDGDHALRILQDSRAGFGLVLLDSKMPGRSSAETFRQLREQVPELPVLFWSGRASDGAIEDLLKEARTDFIQKPYRARDLAERVHRLTHPPAPQPGGSAT